MGGIAFQWVMERVETLISNRISSDINVLHGILEQLETIDVPTAMSLSENTCFRELVYVSEEGTYVGWPKALPAMKAKWQQAGSPPITITNPTVVATYLPYDNAPSPQVDKDFQVDVSVDFPFSGGRGGSFHRRICTTDP